MITGLLTSSMVPIGTKTHQRICLQLETFSRLCRDVLGFETFEDYCRERWDMRRDYANKLIASASVLGSLDTIVSIQPTSEAQARPLTRLRERWDMVRRYADRLITSSKVVEKINADNCQQIPISEAQTRPLTRLESEQHFEMVLIYQSFLRSKVFEK